MPYSGPEVSTRHHYVPSAGDWPVVPPCAECDMPKGNRVHEVPAVPAGAREIDDRVLGETSQR